MLKKISASEVSERVLNGTAVAGAATRAASLKDNRSVIIMTPTPAPQKTPKPPTRLARLLKRPKMPAAKCSPVEQETSPVHVQATKQPDNSKSRRLVKLRAALCCSTAVAQDAIKAQPHQQEEFQKNNPRRRKVIKNRAFSGPTQAASLISRGHTGGHACPGRPSYLSPSWRRGLGA